MVTDGKGAKHLSGHEDFKALGAPYKGDPAAEGASAARSDNRRANTEKYLEQLKDIFIFRDRSCCKS